MIQAICGDCKALFVAAVILGMISCPKCGSTNTYVATTKEKSRPQPERTRNAVGE